MEADKNKVSECEEFYAREQKQTLEDWQKNKDKSRSTIAEMAITLVLHRLLGNRFIVARASKFDDYTHGIDNILIDKETGSIVCGFDDVLGYNGDDGGDKKSKRVNESLLRGGSFLDYGATIEKGKVLRKDFRNIPTFFVSISKDELDIILSDLEKNTESTENEKRLISKIVNSLEKQKKEADSMAIMVSLRNNLNNFTKSLEVIKKYLNE